MSRIVAPKGTESSGRFVAPRDRSADGSQGVLSKVKKLVKDRTRPVPDDQSGA